MAMLSMFYQQYSNYEYNNPECETLIHIKEYASAPVIAMAFSSLLLHPFDTIKYNLSNVEEEAHGVQSWWKCNKVQDYQRDGQGDVE